MVDGVSEGHIFLSYSRSDGYAAAAQIEAALVRYVPVWLDTRDLIPSRDFTAELERAIEKSIAVVVCVTSDVRRADSFVRREIAFAELCRRPTVVARAEEVLPPIAVSTLTFFELWRDWDGELGRLVDFCASTSALESGRPATDRGNRGEYLADTYRNVVAALHDRVTLRSDDQSVELVELQAEVLAGTAGTLDAEARIGLARFLRGSRSRVLVLGEPGSGKTVTSLALVRDLASEALTDESAPIPVLLQAATALGPDGEVRSLRAWLTAEVPILGDELEQLLAAGMAIAIVDGLDELPEVVRNEADHPTSRPRAAVLDILRALPRVVATSRPDVGVVTYAWTTVIRLVPLTDYHVQQFLEGRVNSELSRDPIFIDAVRSPLLLSIVADLASTARWARGGASTVEEWRDMLFDQYARKTYDREARRQPLIDGVPPLDVIKRALGRIAIRDSSFGGSRNLFTVAELRSETIGWDAAARFIEEMGLVIRTGRHLRFVHAMLRDYFAFTEASRALRDESPQMRDAAAWALWAVPDPRAVDALIVALDDPYEYARGSAAAALGRIGDHRALPALRRLSSDQTPVQSRYGRTVGDIARRAIRALETSTQFDPL
jgi:hypothetical protein